MANAIMYAEQQNVLGGIYVTCFKMTDKEV
jgi:hypothetical protein